MTGRIVAADIATVKELALIEDVVREHVTLKRVGSALVGLCPFHDEKTGSFNVRPAVGAWHCFGCDEGGDVISFVQKIDHLTFAEAVARLAGQFGVELHYEDGGPGRTGGEGPGRRARLVEAHRVAEEFYAATLLDTSVRDARTARDFMRERGFDSAVARRFGVGYAPRGGDTLLRHLRAKGFTDDEAVLGGLVGRGSRGLYDRFRGRLVWPIRDITGDTVGFGARRLFDDDRIDAKYLNTSETPLYKKSSVLYGLDMAKKAISRDRQAVVVEGYTDVMACQLAGVESAVATCGTAFGADHIKILRRLIRDEADLAPARVVFTFDGDAAGQKAAMRAFEDDRKWASQSFVAVAADGQDPCELRMREGDAAVRALIDDAVPMFEFAVRTTISRFDLGAAEGRVAAVKAVAPIVAHIRDRSLRPEYVRSVAGWLGVDVEQVRSEVSRASSRLARADSPARPSAGPAAEGVDAASHEKASPDAEPTAAELAQCLPRPDLRHPAVLAERQLLQCLLQYPQLAGPDPLERVPDTAFLAPAHQAVAAGIRAAGDDWRHLSAAAWTAAVLAQVPVAAQSLVTELAVAAVPTRMDSATGMPAPRFVAELLNQVRARSLAARIADLMSALRRLDADGQAGSADYRETSAALQELQREAAQLRTETT